MGDRSFFSREWYQNGILSIQNLLTTSGQLMSYQDFLDNYHWIIVRVLEKSVCVKECYQEKIWIESSLSLEENIEIANLKQLIASVSAELDSVVQHLVHQLSAAEIQRDIVLALVDMQRKLQIRIQELSSTLEMLYEREVQRLLEHQQSCEALCANDKTKLNDETETVIGFLKVPISTKFLFSHQILHFMQ